MKQLREFASDKGYVMLEQLQITDMDEFYSRWKDGISSQGQETGTIEGFPQFLHETKVDHRQPRE